MSDRPFGHSYAEQYDRIYGTKDYEAECDLLEAIFQRHGSGPIRSVLDLGCGTGNHSLPLARRGYQVVGVDRSPAMLARAREKAASLAEGASLHPPVFREGDVRTVRVDKSFDAALMMFAVLGYQSANDDVAAALDTVRRHLRPGGLFACDVWYGPAVLAIRPSNQLKEVPLREGGKLLRFASGNLDVARHVVEVHIRTWQLGGSGEQAETSEVHLMRFFFPQELAYFLKTARLDLLSLTAMPELDRPAGESTWNVVAVARAV
jgi:SAM-dependent methyltransferase